MDMMENIFTMKQDPIVGAVMVVGAGIAGIQASLDLADAGFLVHLVEEDPQIGGIMAQLDKTFPANDCSMCVISPKLVERAGRIKDAGYAGVYHALRLREGRDTGIPPEKRMESMRNFKEAGLKVGTCVEPIGPEHTIEELVQAILLAASIEPVFSGAARRIEIPGTEMAKRGMISELRMAQIVAASILGTPRTVKGFCTHEPCTLAALAGANLFWAESGSNPRDTREKTEQGRGLDVEACARIYRESEWDTREGPSAYFV